MVLWYKWYYGINGNMVLMVICGIIDNREHKILQIAYDRISDLGYVFFTFVKKNPVQKDFLPSPWFVCQQTQYKIYFQNTNMVLWIYFLPFLQILNISAKKCRKTPIFSNNFSLCSNFKAYFLLEIKCNATKNDPNETVHTNCLQKSQYDLPQVMLGFTVYAVDQQEK